MSTLTTPLVTRVRSDELPLYRLHLLRAGYLFMAVGLALVKWPLVLDGAASLPLFEGVVACLLTAMSLLALLDGELDAATQEVLVSCSLVVVIAAVVPWRFVWQQYVRGPGERWR